MTDSACVNDTDSIDLTIGSGRLSADLIVADAVGLVPNPLYVDADGVHVAGGDGWLDLPATLTATGSPLGNISYYTTSVDLRALLGPGAHIRFTQNGSSHYFTVVLCSATQLSLYLVDDSTVDSSAITAPAFSVAANPAGQVFGGPLVVNTGDDVFELYWTAEDDQWATRSIPVWASANAAAMTRTTNSYANMSAAGYASNQLPFRGPSAQGLTWQFRYTGGVSYASGQTAAGLRMTAVTADASGAGGSQDTTNIFGEQTTFTANAELWHDSGWVPINPSVAVKDYLALMPQFKSDGTRVVTISQTDVFSIRGRLVVS